MSQFAHRHVGRAVVTVALLLVTQVVFAGQLCAAVMVSHGQGDCPAQVSAGAGEVSKVAAALQPYSGDKTIPASTCLTAFDGMSMVVLQPGGAPLIHLAPPSGDRSTTALANAFSLSVPLPVASAGPPLRAYILFHRFLS